MNDDAALRIFFQKQAWLFFCLFDAAWLLCYNAGTRYEYSDFGRFR